MTAFNIVRFRVKPDHQEQFIAKHRGINPGLKGFRGGALVKTGENTFCFIGEWANFQKIVDARPSIRRGSRQAFSHQAKSEESACQENDSTQKASLIP